MAEISEGFCTAAILFDGWPIVIKGTNITSYKALQTYFDHMKSKQENSIEILEKHIMPKMLKVADSNRIQYGSQKSEFIKAYGPKWSTEKEKDVALENLIQGISGAMAVHDWFSTQYHEPITPGRWTGYLTGAVWPPEVEKFRVKAHGMDDYNSSDLIIKTGSQDKHTFYYGISLKKKGVALTTKKKTPDPTVINKAFDTVLNKNDPKIQDVLREVKKHKEKFFSNVVREAVKSGNPLAGSKLPPLSHEKLWKENLREYKNGTTGTLNTRALINIKGDGKVNLVRNRKKGESDRQYVTIGEGQPISLYKASTGDRPWKMRDFVNRRIQKYFSGKGSLESVLQDNANTFANALITLILKEDLYKELDKPDKKLDGNLFAFALITGVGKLHKTKKDNNVILRAGETKELHMIICGLAALANSKKPYIIKKVPNPATNENNPDKEDDAAKVFYDLSRDKVTILNLEIRYKGSFTPQPQFQATISPKFKDYLKDPTGSNCLFKTLTK
jgi:hypothetical protein